MAKKPKKEADVYRKRPLSFLASFFAKRHVWREKRMEPTINSVSIGIDTVWVLLCAALVFFMEAGFAALEAGFIHSRNSLNIIMKVFCSHQIEMIMKK